MTGGSRALTDLGLTQYEARAYAALVRRESFTAAELAAESGIPRQRIYDVLAGLVARGFARDHHGTTTSFSATDPDTVVDALLSARRRELITVEDQAKRTARELRESWTLGRDETAPLDYVDVVRDLTVLGLRLEQMMAEAGRRILMFTKSPFVSDSEAGLKAARRVIEAGGEVRCLYESSILDDPEAVEVIVEFGQVGEQARVVERLPMRFLLTDDTRALFSLADPVAGGLTSTNIAVEHPAMVATLTYAFEKVWQDAVPWDRALRRARRGSTS